METKESHRDNTDNTEYELILFIPEDYIPRPITIANTLRLGAHAGFRGSLKETIFDSLKCGMNTTQFFLGNPQAFKRSVLSPDDIIQSKKLLEHWPMAVFSHFPYVANLAGSRDTLAWRGNSAQDSKTGAMLKQLEYELSILDNFKDSGVVIHPGNHKVKSEGLKVISETIEKITFTESGRLVLENSAGQGSSLATTLEEIREIIHGCQESTRKHLGVCIDTCHLFAVGDYDISKVCEMERFLLDYDSILGYDTLSLIHLNDSEKPLGSRVDRHAPIGMGKIWGESSDSLIFLLRFCKERNIPILLETSYQCIYTVLKLCELYGITD